MAKETLVWRREVQSNVPLFNEGDITLDAEGTQLKCLVGYNSFRTWPITKQSPEGELDAQNLVVYLNVNYLEDLGYTNSESYFVFNPATDRFIIRGMRYKCEGHTHISQLGDKPVWMLLTMQRDDLDVIEPTIEP
jgi:hypothetical protein